MAGMAHQLTKRNMPAGKRFAHALRLDDMLYHFMNSHNAAAVLELRAGGDRDLALAVSRVSKRLGIAKENDEPYNRECEQIANRLDRYRDNLILDKQMEQTEQYGLALIDSFQWKLFKKYLEETNK